MGDQGWGFSPALPDAVNGFAHLHQAYTASRPDYIGRVTVPVLWDKATRRFVSNESSEIIRMCSSEFARFSSDTTDYYPAALRPEIDAINTTTYADVDNGVYRCRLPRGRPADGSRLEAVHHDRAF